MDTGPLVAYLYTRDAFHDWASEKFKTLDLPFITCEPVLTEACFLVARNGQPPVRALEPVARGVVEIGLQVEKEMAALQRLMVRYDNVPMSLADACLVRLAEITGLPICTLDGDFEIYRAHRHRPLTLIMPDRSSFHDA